MMFGFDPHEMLHTFDLVPDLVKANMLVNDQVEQDRDLELIRLNI